MAEGSEKPETASDFVESFSTVSLRNVRFDWRDTKTANQCLEHLCLSKHLSDVNLRFNKEPSAKLPAHKFVLSMRSRVFEAMFYGNSGLAKNEVTIDDVSSETMRILIRFMYTDKADINGKNVLKCLHASKLYAVAGLIAVCSSFLEKNINAGNVCTLHEQAIHYSMKGLQTKCYDFMIENASDVFQSNGFQRISKSTLVRLLKSDDLAEDEENIFRAASAWAEAQCLSTKITATPDNKRRCLGEALYEVRFPIMSIEDFAKIVTPTGILTSDEQIMLYQYLASKGSSPLNQFISRERSGKIVTIDMRRNSYARGFANHGYILSVQVRQPFQGRIKCAGEVIIKAVTGSFASKVKRVEIGNFNISKNHEFKLEKDKITFLPPLQISDGQSELVFDTNEFKESSSFYGFQSRQGDEVSHNIDYSTELNGVSVSITMIPEGLHSISFAK